MKRRQARSDRRLRERRLRWRHERFRVRSMLTEARQRMRTGVRRAVRRAAAAGAGKRWVVRLRDSLGAVCTAVFASERGALAFAEFLTRQLRVHRGEACVDILWPAAAGC